MVCVQVQVGLIVYNLTVSLSSLYKSVKENLKLGISMGGVGLSRSCSATFEQLFGFGATFSPSSNFSDFEHFFPFLITFSPF